MLHIILERNCIVFSLSFEARKCEHSVYYYCIQFYSRERETRKVAAALVLAARHTTLWQFSLSAAATQTK